MTDIELEHIFEVSRKVYQYYDKGEIDKAVKLTQTTEALALALSDNYERHLGCQYIAGCLIDIGDSIQEESMVKRGTQYYAEWAENHANPDTLGSTYYNLANGYFTQWKFNAVSSLNNATDSENHRLARHYYRLSMKNLQSSDYTNGLASLVWTNYGNTLDTVGRGVEAITAYDVALSIDPEMGMALGNKAVALSYLAPIVYGISHQFYFEAIRLLNKAMTKSLPRDARLGFEGKLQSLNEFLEKHGEMKPEEAESIKPINDFHSFLCEFCAKHGLFLNPVSFLGEEGKAIYGDPIFITKMYASIKDNHKFDRYITFLNEIKQDYVLGRYFLVQSQYTSSNIDAVDEGVSLFHPLDYSLYSSYIQLLKAAMKQAISVIDKVAYFLYDYCKLKTPKPHQVDFRRIFGGDDTIRKDFHSFASPHLFALFNLSHDISPKGDWNIIYEYRNAITHRFLILHDFQPNYIVNTDIPRESENGFLNNTILAYKIARAAIIYLILFVEHQEYANLDTTIDKTLPIYSTPVEGVFRHQPDFPSPH